MKNAMVAVVLVACGGARELAPGETECTTRQRTTIFGAPVPGVRDTHCRTGQAKAATGWWCTPRADGLGWCMKAVGECEAFRGTRPEYAACRAQPIAICAGVGCLSMPEWCSSLEREAGRDGSACVAQP